MRMSQQQQSTLPTAGRIDLFEAIGVALVALSAVVLVAVLYVSVGSPSLDIARSPVLATAVFTLAVAAVAGLAQRVAP